MLGAAIGVAVEIADEARDIEFRQGADRERHRRGARQHIGHEVLAQRQRPTLGGQGHGNAAHHQGVRWHGGQREFLIEDQVAWTFESGDDRGRAGAYRGDRHDDGGAATGRGNRHLLDFRRGIGCDRAIDRNAERIIAGGRFGIDDVETQPRTVAHRHEARQGGGDDDRIADDHVCRGVADLGLAPGDSHDAHRAVEGRDIEVNRCRAIILHLDDAGIVAERLLRRSWCREGAIFSP